MFATEPGINIQRLAVLDEFKKRRRKHASAWCRWCSLPCKINLVADAKANTLPHQENWIANPGYGARYAVPAGDKAALRLRNTINDLQARIRGLKADIEDKKRQITSLDTDKDLGWRGTAGVERKKLARRSAGQDRRVGQVD